VYKFLGAIVLIVVTIAVQASSYPVFLAVVMVLTVTLFMSAVPLLFVARRILFLELFILGIALLSLLQPEGASGSLPS
jgi:hypothetical protein